ncbi:hypothetical protein Tco_0974230 [Tanacetum coccineum]|uniref:Uncharacterized protein n=1 Tax=Tanacetum coccineum TaxID=301880 RepID=A0ABQ5EB41_9ASTR
MILQDTIQVSLAEHKSREEQEARENVALVYEHLPAEEIEKLVEDLDNFDDSSPPRHDDTSILGTRLEPMSDKESPEVDFVQEKEEDTTPMVDITNIVILVNVDDEEDEITDEVFELRRRAKGRNVEETRISPISSPTRSPRNLSTLVSSDTEKLQELTVTHPTPSSGSSVPKLTKTNRLLSLIKAKPNRFKRYKNFFHELQGRYGYLFAHLKKRFMPRTSSDQLADNLHDVMMETLPSLVKEKVTEQVKKEVPVQVRDQVPVYLAEGFFLERKSTKEETERLIAAILQERGQIVARRANDCIVSITEPDYKNLNKNDIEDMYLLIMNNKVPDYANTGLLWSLSVFIGSSVIWERVHDFQLGIESYQQKIKLTAPTIIFPGIEEFDVTLEGLKSYYNDVKYGYVQKELTNNEVELLKLFEEEIEVRLNYRDQMRRWEIGNGPVSVSTDTNGLIKVLPPKTAEEILARERERKARTTLLMALPEDHLAKFHKMTDAKEMWEAIKSRFDGNDESKKMQKYILKQQFEGFSVSNSEGLHKGYDRIESYNLCQGEPISFDKTKVECYSLSQDMAFARRVQIQEERKIVGKGEIEKGVDWTKSPVYEQENYALMACSSSELRHRGNENQSGDASIEIQAYTQALKKQSKTSESDIRSSDFNSCESNYSEETHESMPEPVVNKPKVVSEPKVWSDAPIIEEYESDSEDEHVSLPTKEQEIPSFAFINTDKHVKTPRQTVIEQNTCSQSPKPDKKDCSGLMSKKLEPKAGFHKSVSPFRKSFNRTTALRTKFSKQKVNTAEDYPQRTLQNKGIVNSRCSRHMTGNKAYLAEYQDFLIMFDKEEQGPQEANHNAGTEDNIDAGDSEIEAESAQDYFVKLSGRSLPRILRIYFFKQELLKLAALTQLILLAHQLVLPVFYGGLSFTDLTNTDQDDSKIHALEEIYDNPTAGIFTNASYDDEGAVADFTNLETIVNVSPIPTSRINSIHPSTLILGDPKSTVQTRTKLPQSSGAFKLLKNCCEFNIQKLGILVDLPYGNKANLNKIGFYRNQKYERGVVVLNPLGSFLAFCFLHGFKVKQMDVKSVLNCMAKLMRMSKVSQPPGFIDPNYPKKVYRVVKSLNGTTKHLEPGKKHTIVATSTIKDRIVFACSKLDVGKILDSKSNVIFHSKQSILPLSTTVNSGCYEKKLIQELKIHTEDNVADLQTNPRHLMLAVCMLCTKKDSSNGDDSHGVIWDIKSHYREI